MLLYMASQLSIMSVKNMPPCLRMLFFYCYNSMTAW